MFNPLLTISDDARLMLRNLIFMPGYPPPQHITAELERAGLIVQGRAWKQLTKKAWAHYAQLRRNGSTICETGAIEYVG